MASTLDKWFSQPVKPPKGEVKAQALPSTPQPELEIKVEEALTPEAVVVKRKKRERQPFPPVAPANLPPSYFVSASYDGRLKKAVVKLYEPESGQMYFWYDNTGHKPYCLTSIPQMDMERFERVKSHEGFDGFITEKRLDPLNDKPIEVTKIICKDPLAIGGRPGGTIRDIIPEDYPRIFGMPIQDSDAKIWESKIKYYQSYIYDKQLLPGMIYEVKDNNLVAVVVESAHENLAKIGELFKDCTKEEREYAEMWAQLLEYPAPQFRRAAIDIEVYSPLSNRVPDAREGACPVIACSIYSSDGDKKVLVLKREGMEDGDPELTKGLEVEFCESEEQLLRKVFDVLNDYPFILTLTATTSTSATSHTALTTSALGKTRFPST
jgi:DNA polymerase, archaea type